LSFPDKLRLFVIPAVAALGDPGQCPKALILKSNLTFPDHDGRNPVITAYAVSQGYIHLLTDEYSSILGKCPIDVNPIGDLVSVFQFSEVSWRKE
jgi:hypothetical protein